MAPCWRATREKENPPRHRDRTPHLRHGDHLRVLVLREEGDHFLGLIRVLNAAAVARDEGQEDDARFREARAQMHTSVERMAELAGQEEVVKVEAAEAEAAETPVEPAVHELDPARREA